MLDNPRDAKRLIDEVELHHKASGHEHIVPFIAVYYEPADCEVWVRQLIFLSRGDFFVVVRLLISFPFFCPSATD